MTQIVESDQRHKLLSGPITTEPFVIIKAKNEIAGAEGHHLRQRGLQVALGSDEVHVVSKRACDFVGPVCGGPVNAYHNLIRETAA